MCNVRKMCNKCTLRDECNVTDKRDWDYKCIKNPFSGDCPKHSELFVNGDDCTRQLLKQWQIWAFVREQEVSLFRHNNTLKKKRFQLCPKSIQLSMEPMTEKSPPLWETPDDSFSDRRPKNQHWMTTSSHLSDVCEARRRRSWQETEKINLGRYVMRENKGILFYFW